MELLPKTKDRGRQTTQTKVYTILNYIKEELRQETKCPSFSIKPGAGVRPTKRRKYLQINQRLQELKYCLPFRMLKLVCFSMLILPLICYTSTISCYYMMCCDVYVMNNACFIVVLIIMCALLL